MYTQPEKINYLTTVKFWFSCILTRWKEARLS